MFLISPAPHEVFHANPVDNTKIVLSLFSTIAGLLLGSFYACIAWRWSIHLSNPNTPLHDQSPKTKQSIRLLKPARSICTHCFRNIPWYHNIPVLSYILLKGRCACTLRTPISAKYPIIEAATAVLFAITALHAKSFDDYLLLLLFSSLAILISAVDWETMVIPDLLNASLAAAGLTYNYLQFRTPQALLTTLTLATIPTLLLLAITQASKLFAKTELFNDGGTLIVQNRELKIQLADGPWETINPLTYLPDPKTRLRFFNEKHQSLTLSRADFQDLSLPDDRSHRIEFTHFAITSHRPGMGYGDIKLVLALSFWLPSLHANLFALITASALGIIYSALTRKRKLPLGPFLCFAYFSFLFFLPSL